MDYGTTAHNENFASDSSEAEAGGRLVASSAGTRVLLVADSQNVLVLPEGVTLDDLRVEGRDLVFVAENGITYVVLDGAVFVPQIVVDGITVPPLNLAALLLGDEPEPAAGPLGSSGNNFAYDVAPMQAAFDLGDLLPYTDVSTPDARREGNCSGGWQ